MGRAAPAERISLGRKVCPSPTPMIRRNKEEFNTSKFLLTTVCAFGLLLSVASAEEAEKELQKFEFTRWVPTGTKRTIWFLYGANPDCSPWDFGLHPVPKTPS
jgi:hypothetical protein